MSMPERYPVRLNLRLDEKTRDQVQHTANRLGISSASLIRLLVKSHLNEYMNQ